MFQSSYVTLSRESFVGEPKIFPKSDLDMEEHNENSQQVEHSLESGCSEFLSEMRVIENSDSN